MKDEEMAEERKADYGIDLCCLCRECDVGVISPCQHKKDAMYGYKDGFLAGLKAGRPQWHDLRKDPTDLPKKEKLGKSFTVAFAFNEKTQEYYSFDCAEYIDKGKFCTHTNNDDKVIVWCEIPTFDKE